MKTIVMVAALALVTGASLACFGLFSKDDDRPAVTSSCDGLTGQAKIDCEKKQSPQH